jgi:uncharacterized protein
MDPQPRSRRPTVGLAFPPDGRTLALLAPALARCEHLEVTPETLWAPGDRFVPNAYFAAAAKLVEALGVPVIAHGVGLCTTTAHPADADRQRRWLDRLAETHRALPFGWITEHSGATTLAGDHVALPVAVPWTTRSRDVLRARLDDLRDIVGEAGVEHSAFYCLLDPPQTEPGFLGAAIGETHGLVLDLHNLVALERNHGLAAEDWLAAAPLHRVIEVHLAGGRSSAGLPVGRTFHLDSHDEPVPGRVWSLLADVLPRLPALRAITLERLEGTVEPDDVDGVVGDLDRAVAAAERWVGLPHTQPVTAPVAALPTATDAEHIAFDALLADALRAADPVAVLRGHAPALPAGPIRQAAERALADPEGLRVTRLLIAQLRFSRLLNGSPEASTAFEVDPAGFTARFRAYHQAVRPTAYDPAAEAAAFASHVRGSPQ